MRRTPRARRDRTAVDRPQVVAHRGSSHEKAEHTLAAYELAIEQKADFVEPDLAVSKDGVLVCLHDDTLERTTNVEQVFPDRFSADVRGRNGERRWVANDFTVASPMRRPVKLPGPIAAAKSSISRSVTPASASTSLT